MITLLIVLLLCELKLYTYREYILSRSCAEVSLRNCLSSENFSGRNPTLASTLQRLNQTSGEPRIRCWDPATVCFAPLLSFQRPTAPVLYGEVVEQRPPACWFSANQVTSKNYMCDNDMCICHHMSFFPMTRGSASWHAQDSTKCCLLIQLSSIPSMQVLPYRSCMFTWRSRPECFKVHHQSTGLKDSCRPRQPQTNNWDKDKHGLFRVQQIK